MGLCYETGRGVAKNVQVAKKWFLRAAKQGDKTAQYNLGLYYASQAPQEPPAADVTAD